ncbi:MAG: hypothetical protein EKK48_18970 [Candidatus Melainabacteria bacterium]|nr:MAG: hypothetical protein EKK48_18970 [Candidatus Melainabacteria bacterium]
MADVLSSPMLALLFGLVAGWLTLSSLNGKGPSAGTAGLLLIILAAVVVVLGALSVSIFHLILAGTTALVVLSQVSTFAGAFLVGAIIQSFLGKN